MDKASNCWDHFDYFFFAVDVFDLTGFFTPMVGFVGAFPFTAFARLFASIDVIAIEASKIVRRPIRAVACSTDQRTPFGRFSSLA